MSCAIAGCTIAPHKRNVMCWQHLRMLPDALQRTLALLYNDGTGKPRDGYDEACANAIEQVKISVAESLERPALDPMTSWPFRKGER